MKRASSILSLLLAGAFGLSACDNATDPVGPRTAGGTNDETHTEISARVFLPDGATPAVGATVTLVPREGTSAAATGLVDSLGHPVVPRVADGVYSMTSSSGPLTDWTDSVEVVAGRLVKTGDDTLQVAGTISGVVLLQPQHDNRTITVNVLGTDIWTNVGLDGRFTIPELGAGLMRLRFQTTVPDYTPLFTTARLGTSQDLALPDTLRMPYTGVPVVLGLRGVNDTATGDVLLSWRKADHPHVVEYAIYRDSLGALDWSTAAFATTTDTTWRDSTAKSVDRARTWRYRVAVRVSGSATPGAWFEVATVVSVPPALAHLDDIHWRDLGAPGGSFTGFLADSWAVASLEGATDSVRLPVWSSVDGSSWTVSGTAFAPRRSGQAIVRAAGFGAGRLWSFGRSAIGDGVEVSSSADGISWSTATIADSLWPGDASLSVVGSAGRVSLVSRGSRSTVLLGDAAGNWSLVSVTGQVLGLDDTGIWTDGGARKVVRVDAATGRNVLSDLGTWSGTDSLVAVVPWQGSVLLQAGSRLWWRDGATWSARSSTPVNALAAEADQLLVRDPTGGIHRGSP